MTSGESTLYEPTWESLDARPLPSWYDNAKIGILMHWGVYSVPAFGSEWFWRLWKLDKQPAVLDYINKNFPPDFTYEDFAPQFKAEHYDPDQWAKLFAKSGAKYVILTAKHHDGYTLWPSAYSPHWNALDIGPKRDLIGDFAKAIQGQGLTMGLYYSLFEWFHPLYLSDRANGFKTDAFVQTKALPEMEDLINRYKPSIFFSDGVDKGSPEEYWKSKDFLAWLYNESPVKNEIVVNDRWGEGTAGKHGGYINCGDRNYNQTKLVPRKWENAMSLDKQSWGYRTTASLEDYCTIEELLRVLVQTISCGGNILINIGPSKEGRIMPIYEEKLLQLGDWLQVNEESIYKSSVWKSQQDSINENEFYTQRDGNVYGLVLGYPKSGKIEFGDVHFEKVKSVSLLGYDGKDVEFGKNNGEGLVVNFPAVTPLDKAKYVYVLRFVLKK